MNLQCMMIDSVRCVHVQKLLESMALAILNEDVQELISLSSRSMSAWFTAHLMDVLPCVGPQALQLLR